MKVQIGGNDVKVYDLTATENVKSLSGKKVRRKKKQDPACFIQDFKMKDITNCLRISEDGNYMIACGIYKPTIKCYDFSQLSVKFERGVDAEVHRFVILGDDYSKIAFLENNRYLEFHNQCGQIFRKKIPYQGRDLVKNKCFDELYISSSNKEIYRFNFRQGRFLKSFDSCGKVVNRLSFTLDLGLLFGGTDDGCLTYFDPRDATCETTIDVVQHMLENTGFSVNELPKQHMRVTSMVQHDKFTMAVGNNNGQVLLYDIRAMRKPFLVKDHLSRAPIKAINFHTSGNVFSMDTGIVKIWDKNSGEACTSIMMDDGDNFFNDMQVIPNTGMCLFATESPQMKAYFIPELGPAPKWCSYLDTMSEEYEENSHVSAASMFDDRTFVTREQLVEASLTELIGTNHLEAYLHGYYIKTDLLNKARQIINPTDEEHVSKPKPEETTLKVEAEVKKKVVKSAAKKRAITKDESVIMSKAAGDKRMRFDVSKFDDEEDDSENEQPGKKNAQFKRRQAEIERDEEQFLEKESSDESDDDEDNESASDSDADSVMDMIMEEKRKK